MFNVTYKALRMDYMKDFLTGMTRFAAILKNSVSVIYVILKLQHQQMNLLFHNRGTIYFENKPGFLKMLYPLYIARIAHVAKLVLINRYLNGI